MEALRLVFDELHASSVRTTVAFPNYPDLFDDEGRLADPKHHEHAADTMLDELVWWGEALRAQRARRPYPAEAA